jgi:hypothetical protein
MNARALGLREDVLGEFPIARRMGCCHEQPCCFGSHQVPSTAYKTRNRRPIRAFAVSAASDIRICAIGSGP